MKFINRGRGTGKTTILIHTAYVMDIPIVVYTEGQKNHVLDQAKRMNCDIEVWTYSDFLSHKLNKHHRQILLDECKPMIDSILDDYFGCDVVVGTMSIPVQSEMAKFNTEVNEDKEVFE